MTPAPALLGEAEIVRLFLRDQAGLLEASLRSEQVRPLLDVYRANLRASAAYRPRVYAGRLTLFRPLSSLTPPTAGTR
jgi:hypothetical protein